MEILNWNEMKLRGLNWHGQNLKDWIELWPNLEGVNCNLAINICCDSDFLFFEYGMDPELKALFIIENTSISSNWLINMVYITSYKNYYNWWLPMGVRLKELHYKLVKLYYISLQQNKPVTMGVIATKSIIVVINMLLYLWVKFRWRSYLKTDNLLDQQYVNAISYKILLQ